MRRMKSWRVPLRRANMHIRSVDEWLMDPIRTRDWYPREDRVRFIYVVDWILQWLSTNIPTWNSCYSSAVPSWSNAIERAGSHRRTAMCNSARSTEKLEKRWAKGVSPPSTHDIQIDFRLGWFETQLALLFGGWRRTGDLEDRGEDIEWTRQTWLDGHLE